MPLNDRFERLRPPPESGGGVGAGEGVAALRGEFDVLAWADPFGPDGALPSSVADAMAGAIRSGIGGHYEPPTGESNLRAALARRVGARLGRTLDPDRHVLVTPGSDSGLYYALAAVLSPGDEVITFTPSYPSNIATTELLGAVPVLVPLKAEDGYRLDPADVASRITPHTRAVILTHPNNPTTTVHDRDHLRALASIIVEHDLVLICDQAFEDHLFDGAEFTSPAALQGMWERTLSVHSFSKGYGLSGLRVGYIVGHERLLEPLLQAAVLVLGAPNTLAQIGALAALEDETLLPSYRAEFDGRRRQLFEALHDVPGVRLAPAESGILSWVDISQLGSAADVARHLQVHARVLVNEGDAYGPGGEGHLRIVHGAIADRRDFTDAVDRIRAALLTYPH